MKTPSVVQGGPTQAQERASKQPAPSRRPQQPVDTYKQKKEPGVTPTVTKTPNVARAAAAIRRQHAEGKISQTEAQDRLAKLHVYGGRKLSKAELFPTPHGVAGTVARGIGQVAEAGIYSPAGIYQTGRAVTKDVGAAAHGDVSLKRSRKLGAQIAKSTLEDVRHPLRNIGFLTLDALAAASAGAGTAARVGAAGKAISEGGRVGAVAKALAHAPEPRLRTLRSGKLEAHPLESRNKAVAAIQRARDKRLNAKAAAQPEGRVGRKTVPRRIGKAERGIRVPTLQASAH